MKLIVSVFLIFLMTKGETLQYDVYSDEHVFGFIHGYMVGIGLEDVFSCVKEMLHDKIYKMFSYKSNT